MHFPVDDPVLKPNWRRSREEEWAYSTRITPSKTSQIFLEAKCHAIYRHCTTNPDCRAEHCIRLVLCLWLYPPICCHGCVDDTQATLFRRFCLNSLNSLFRRFSGSYLGLFRLPPKKPWIQSQTRQYFNFSYVLYFLTVKWRHLSTIYFTTASLILLHGEKFFAWGQPSRLKSVTVTVCWCSSPGWRKIVL